MRYGKTGIGVVIAEFLPNYSIRKYSYTLLKPSSPSIGIPKLSCPSLTLIVPCPKIQVLQCRLEFKDRVYEAC